jgi:hypothetical protein
MLGFYLWHKMMATFTTPETIGTDVKSFFWLLPLAVAVATVYKALKAGKISALNFIKEIAILFVTIILFMAAVAAVLFAITRIVTG